MRRSRTAAVLLSAVLVFGLAGCGQEAAASAPVQSVAMICGLTDDMQLQKYLGVISTGKEANIKRDSSRKIATVTVKTGDMVEAGDVLFTYDAEQAQTSLEKEKLQYERDSNSLESKKQEKQDLETQKAKAKQSEQLEYTLKIAEADIDIREAEYNLALKAKELEKLESSIQDLDVTAPFGGRIEKAGQADGSDFSTDSTAGDALGAYDAGSTENASDGFIKIVETDNYRVKGTINEMNAHQIYAGEVMTIYSRVDDSRTWSGEVTEVDYKNPVQSQNNGYYDMDQDNEDTQSSKYNFYVAIEDIDGLLIGQHVYMVPFTGEETTAIELPATYIVDAESDPWVWAESNSATLEKRKLSLGEFNSEMNTWVVESGLSDADYIAVPSDSFTEGMPCRENDESAFTDGTNEEGETGDEYTDDGEYIDGGEYIDDGEYIDGGYVDEDGNYIEEGTFVEDGDAGIYDPEIMGEEGGTANVADPVPEDTGYEGDTVVVDEGFEELPGNGRVTESTGGGAVG